MKNDPEAVNMVYNELNKIQRLIEARKAKLQALYRGKTYKDVLSNRPKRYSVSIKYEAWDDFFGYERGNPFAVETDSFIVEEGTIFRPVALDCSMFVTVSEFAANPTLLQLPLMYREGESNRGSFFEFDWRIYDTGSDREWQNHPQPSPFLATGLYSPMWLQNRGVLGPGTEVFVSIEPFRNYYDNTPLVIKDLTLIIGMWGHEQRVDL
jgi:hypothetical protein